MPPTKRPAGNTEFGSRLRLIARMGSIPGGGDAQTSSQRPGSWRNDARFIPRMPASFAAVALRMA